MTRPVPSLALPGHWAPEHQAATASFESATENISPLWALSTTQVPRKDCTEPSRDFWIRLHRHAFFHSPQDQDPPRVLTEASDPNLSGLSIWSSRASVLSEEPTETLCGRSVSPVPISAFVTVCVGGREELIKHQSFAAGSVIE